MPTFNVTLRSTGTPPKTRRVEGVEAISGESARFIAEVPGWKSVDAVLAPRTDKTTRRPKLFPRKELVLMCKSLASMLRARLKTVEALNFYANNLPIPALRMCLKSVASQIEAGEEPYKAFESTRRFDDTFVGLVRAGTLSGNLAASLDSVAKRMKSDMVFKAKIRKAVLMPGCILVFLYACFVFAQTRLVPMVEKMLTEINMPPDAFSSFVFRLSHVTQVLWIPVGLGLAAFAVALMRSATLRNQILGFAMSRWRLLRELVMGVRQLTFLGTLHMLVSNNIPVDEALDTCARVMRGTPFEPEIREAKRRYGLGNSLADSIRKYTSCDETVSHMIEVGERVADVDGQLALLVTMYEERTADRMEDFTTVVTVVGLIVTVLVMGFVYVSAYMPIVLSGPRMMQGGM